MNVYQSGRDIGGTAYLLFLSSLSYAIFSWLEEHQLRIISACVFLGICILFIILAGSNTGWGLILLIIVSFVSLFIAVKDKEEAF
ncbi:MAG: hypothetical protein N2572_02455 [Syntrophales bacterium]|nr:hypothetical protein [Syntrophales bacterium]